MKYQTGTGMIMPLLTEEKQEPRLGTRQPPPPVLVKVAKVPGQKQTWQTISLLFLNFKNDWIRFYFGEACIIVLETYCILVGCVRMPMILS